MTKNRNKTNPSSKWWQQDHFQKFGATVRVWLRSNQNYNIYWMLQIFWMERWRGWQKWLLPLNINITILKSKLPSSIVLINLNLAICYNVSKPQKFNIDYNFHRTLLTDAHSKHILITLVIYSQNFRKLQEWFSKFEWDENRTQKKKSNWLLIKKTQKSVSWVGGITNEIKLFCVYDITKKTSTASPFIRSKLAQIKPMFTVFTDTRQSYVATFFTKASL